MIARENRFGIIGTQAILGQSGTETLWGEPMARKFTLKSRSAAEHVDFSAELNPAQLAVATAGNGPMMVIAGAGTGKTRALTYRMAWLVGQGVDPGRIMLVTFTNRAAREMLSRVELLVKHRTGDLWGGTFHHIANRILRQHGRVLGISPEFTILDREDSRDLIAACVDDAGVKTGQRRFPRKAVLGGISSFLQNTLEPLETVLARRYPMFTDDLEAIEKVLRLYTVRKFDNQLLDYDDLLAFWLRLLREQDAIRNLLAEQFMHILVDEYQDTNAIQAAIIDLLGSRHRNVTVVGDDAQSIYSFRGATFENIITFNDRYPDAQEIRLETNYRSTPQILALANASIAQNTRRLEKNLHAVRPDGLAPAVVTCYDRMEQSRFLAEYILHLMDQGRGMLDIAILYRSHWHSLDIQLELTRRNIPFRVRGELRFFEQAHIKDVLSFLRILHNPRDEIAWFRVLRLLPRVGSALSRRLWNHIETDDNPLQKALQPTAIQLFPGGARSFYESFVNLTRTLDALGSPAEMIDRISTDFYDDYLTTHYDNAALRREDVRGLMNFATQYNNLEAFLADLALSGELSGETCVLGPEETDYVILSTVHQAKGLEWPIVLIPWLADGRFPTDMAINTAEEEEEERRVFHVAVTRAKDELYLVVPQMYRARGQGLVMMKPSRFLTEIAPGLTEPMILEDPLPHLFSGETPKDSPPLLE